MLNLLDKILILFNPLLGSFRIQTEKFIKQLYRTNPTIKTYRLSWWRKPLLQLADAYTYGSTVWLFVRLFFLILLLAYLTGILLNTYLDIPNLGTIDSILEGFIYQTQYTLIVLIPPFIIGFVSFIMRSASSDIIYRAYIAYSGALLFMISGLIYVVYFAIYKLVKPLLTGILFPESLQITLIATVLPDFVFLIWFVLNVVGLIRFLGITVNFISPVNQLKLLEAYIVNVCWQKILRDFNLNNYPELLSRVHYPIEYGMRGYMENPEKLTMPLAYPKNLYDVRLQLLNLLVKRRKFSEDKEKIHIAFPANFTEKYDDRVLLANASGYKFRLFDEIIIKLAFRFKRAKECNAHSEVVNSLNDAFLHLVDFAHNALSNHEIVMFRQHLDRVKDFHIFMLNLAIWDYPVQNIFYVPSQLDLRFLSISCSKIYDSLSRRAVNALNALDADAQYFEAIAYIPYYIYGRIDLKKASSLVIANDLNSFAEFLYYRLEEWWRGKLRLSNLGDLNTRHDAKLNPQYSDIFKEAITSFVESWEAVLIYSIKRDLNTSYKLEQLTTVGEHAESNLFTTSNFLCMSIKNSNRESAIWMTDVLLKWCARCFPSEFRYAYRSKVDWLITLEYDNNGIKNTSDDKSEGLSKILQALKNRWFDARFSLLCFLVRKAKKHRNIQTSFLYLLYHSIIQCMPTKEGDLTSCNDNYDSDINYIRIVSIILRDSVSQRGYSQFIDSFDSYRFFDNQDRIANRIYSGKADNYFLDEVIILLCLFWQENQIDNLKKLIYVEVAHDKFSLERIRDRLTLLIDKCKAFVFDDWVQFLQSFDYEYTSDDYEILLRSVSEDLKPQFRSFFEKRLDVTQTKQNKDRVLSDLDLLKEYVLSEKDSIVLNANISQEKINNLKLWVEEAFLSKVEFKLYTPLFCLIESPKSQNEPEKITFRFSNIYREYLVGPPINSDPIFPKKWFIDMCHKILSARILSIMLDRCPFDTVKAITPEDYWNNVSKIALSMSKQGFTPILLVENGATPNWIFDWRSENTDKLKLRNLQVTRDEKNNNQDYICHFNYQYKQETLAIPVYDAAGQVPFSVLLAKEVFGAFDLVKFGDESVVDFDWTKDINDPLTGRLELGFRAVIELNKHRFTKILHRDTSDN